MISVPGVIDFLRRADFGPFIGVPCSVLKPFIDYVIDQSELEYYTANNEGEAVAMAAGAWLGRRKPVVLLQNSGLGNAVNPITSLLKIFRIPILFFVAWRGCPDTKDAPQHELMGKITPDLLSLLAIQKMELPDNERDVSEAIQAASEYIGTTGQSYAFLLKKGSFELFEPSFKDRNRSFEKGKILPTPPTSSTLPTRMQVISGLLDNLPAANLPIISTTGKTSRELFCCNDRDHHFYMVGSMGCASSIGLGIAQVKLQQPMMILDGDGAALMRMEAMASVGHYRPSRYFHVILDNACYESTGGQGTQAPSMDFSALAIACGYQTAVTVSSVTDVCFMIEALYEKKGPHLIHVNIRPGSDPTLGRVKLSPPEIALRFRKAIT